MAVRGGEADSVLAGEGPWHLLAEGRAPPCPVGGQRAFIDSAGSAQVIEDL